MIENKVYRKYEKKTGDIPVEKWEEILKRESDDLKADVQAILESSGLILKQLKESGKIDYIPAKKKD